MCLAVSAVQRRKVRTMTETTIHPSEFIREEMEARGWSMDMLAMRMSPEFGITRLSLDMYFAIGPTEPNLRIGEKSARGLARAFGVSPDYFLNIEAAWLKGVQHDQ